MTQRKDVLYYNWSLSEPGEEDTCPTTQFLGSGHGTHTSGSAVGDTAPYADCAGFTSPGRNGGDGQAPGAKLVMLELGDDVAFLNTMGGTIWNIVDVAYQSGSRIHSFSLGGVWTKPGDIFARFGGAGLRRSLFPQRGSATTWLAHEWQRCRQIS